MKNSKTGIYKIINPNGRVYVGQSIDIINRFKVYKRLHCKQQTRLYRSFIKYGVNKHKFELIEECKLRDLNNRERYWQDYYNVLSKQSGLNCSLTKTNNKSGKQSEQTKLKISRKAKERGKHSVEHKLKIGLSVKGRVVSKEERLSRSVNSPISKIILNFETGIYYKSLKELSISHKYCISYLSRMLTGVCKNTINCKYV